MNIITERLEHAGQSKLALLGIPFDANSSFLKGAAGAPPVIRQAFHSDAFNSWAEAGIDIGARAAIFDAGDLEFTATEAAFDEIEAAVSQLLDRGLAPISLGGDHSITYPILKAFRNKYPRLNILHFDAHPDLYDQLQGNRFSHASPFARIMEDRLADRLVQVGIRAMNAHQRAQAERFEVEVHEMKDWCGHLHLDFDAPLYITIDMDALDPAFAPGVSHHEPGGLSTRDVINLIHSVNASEIVGADIVEFNPTRDLVGMTAMACAKLLKEVAAKML
jgi:agmatinase